MAPKPKVSPEQVINAYYELKRKRDRVGGSIRGLNTMVGEMFGMSGQRVGQIIRKYEDGMLSTDTPESIPPIQEPKVSKASSKVSKLSVPTEPPVVPGLTEARRKWEDAVDPEENEPSRGGVTRTPENITPQELKHLQDENRRLLGRVDQLEARLGLLEASRQVAPLRGSPKTAPRRDQVLEALGDGKVHTYEQLELVIGCSRSAIRNAVANLVQLGQVQVTYQQERRGDRVVPVARVRLHSSIKDLI